MKKATEPWTTQHKIVGPLPQAAVFQSSMLMSIYENNCLFINLQIDNNVGMFFSVCLLMGLLLTNIRNVLWEQFILLFCTFYGIWTNKLFTLKKKDKRHGISEQNHFSSPNTFKIKVKGSSQEVKGRKTST